MYKKMTFVAYTEAMLSWRHLW